MMSNHGEADAIEDIVSACVDLWRLQAPGPQNMFAHPPFLRLRDACGKIYPFPRAMGFSSALSTALKALGLPCLLPAGFNGDLLSAEQAARALHDALSAKHSRRRHLIPLDLLDQLPPLAFGGANVARFSASELCDLFEEQELARIHPELQIDADRFSEFQWLVIEETVELEQKGGARVVPNLLMDFGQDFGRIEPHQTRYPSVVEDALFFLLLGPWEEWTDSRYEWRGFKVPWVHSIDSDIFVRLEPPPSAESLAWMPDIFTDIYGEEVEAEIPAICRLDDRAETEAQELNHSYWEIVEEARKSVLFETPIVHFFTRAFFSDGIDEFLAHMIVIEAALGLHSDYDKSKRLAPEPHKIGATKRLQRRVSGLLGNQRFGEQYDRLFNLRSAFLHGRQMGDISSKERVEARSLARQVVIAIIEAATTVKPGSRESYLDGLVDAGLRAP